jgi:hypothetical protein
MRRQDAVTVSGASRAPMTGYSREQVRRGWATIDGCDTEEWWPGLWPRCRRQASNL